MQNELLKVGELARRSGVSVRTLHHYDEIGLLVPSFTTGAGHRQYTADDALRLSQIRALAGLGLSLRAIREVVEDPDDSPLNALELLHERVRETLSEARVLAERLERLTGTLRSKQAPTLNDLLETLETMSQSEHLFETYYTPEQLADLAQRREDLGEQGMVEAQNAWTQLYADAQAAAEAGLDPTGPEGRDLAARKRALIEAFTGGDAGIEQSLGRMVAENPGVQQEISGEPTAMDFLRRAEAAPGGE